MRLPLPCPCGYECSLDLSGAPTNGGTGEWKREPPEALKRLEKTKSNAQNPPTPKVLRHDSLGGEPIDSNNPLFTGTASAGREAIFDPAGPAAKKCTGLR